MELLLYVIAVYIVGMVLMFGVQAYLTPKYIDELRENGISTGMVWASNAIASVAWPLTAYRLTIELVSRERDA